MSRHFDGSVGTNGSALCTPTKAHYDFTVRTINGEQFVSYNMTPTGPLKSTTTATTGEAAEEGYIALQVGAVTLAARSRLLGVVSWLYYPVARVNIYNDSSPVLLSSFLNVSDTDAFIWGDVITGIEQTAANVTAALLNVDLKLKDSECTFSHTALVYRYKPENLWIPYGIALGLVGASFILGVIVFRRFNPENLTTSFVDTVGVTRNPELDSLALRYRLGLSDTLDDDDTARFRLGQLGDGCVGYGTKESIRSPE
ncbi:hypothetical protein M407DRAFT_33324 [Tulasnella calospora MUT 4182]|uniref:Uncharacterized protein n=1 Tax=Tulasnella calospora MUT 4182 TaxID=1051891 RepID=A0A0C3K6M1_9AGAM|nr:hypothetical protein M407DRAFT_33324 [Tulasnella calospora MUT 4182]